MPHSHSAMCARSASPGIWCAARHLCRRTGGRELHVPIAATETFDALMEAGGRMGYARSDIALESLRLEKGYRAWGFDITANDTPLEAGLGWAVKLRRNTISWDAARSRRSAGTQARRFAGFTVDDTDIVLVGRETILRNGEPVGYLTSGGFGYTIGKNIGYGYVRNADGVDDAFLASGDYELVVATERTKARLHLQPLYDPAGAKGESVAMSAGK